MDKAISFYTLMQYPPFKEAVEKEDTETFNKIIHASGIDTDLPFEIVVCTHRPNAEKPFTWNGPRVEGIERTDEVWMKSSNCSFENKVEQSDDKSLRVELKVMSREGNFTGNIIDHMKRHRKVLAKGF
jgi:hypothetical protein